MNDRFLIALLTSAALAGCSSSDSGSRAGIDPAPEAKASQLISDSFSVAKAETKEEKAAKKAEKKAKKDAKKASKKAEKDSELAALRAESSLISISRSALEKEFLLQGNMILQTEVPTGENLKSKVVVFRERGGKLYLVNASEGHEITSDLPQTLVLAEFPITAQDADRITFDFNAGMTQLFLVGDWYASDFSGKQYSSDYVSVKTRFSYVDSARVNGENQLEVSQIAMLDLPFFYMDFGFPVEIKYYLSPYAPDPTFEPTVSKDFRKFGFFEVNPVLTSKGNSIVRAAKFHPKKQITFAVSENTPADFKQAVKDGILYWNAVFGEDKVKAIEAPKGITAPSIDYNVVQWVPWDSAGFAYADAQMDPRTGEVLHAQVYLTSVFAHLGKVRARAALKQLGTQIYTEDEARKLAEKSEGSAARKARVALQGFKSERLCDFDLMEAFDNSIDQAIAENQSEESILRISQDYVREVVAHEIGHTLGLRHNFAGSLGANFPLSRRAEIVKKYVETGEISPGLVASSSVMEYQVFEEASITGRQIAKGKVALEYDRMAIEALYKGTNPQLEEIPPFCTDTNVGLTPDCARFDTGRSALEYASWKVKEDLRLLPYKFIEAFMYAKAPIFGEDPTPVEEVRLNSYGVALSIMAKLSAAYKTFTTGATTLKVRRNYPVVSETNEKEVRDAELKNGLFEVEMAGGVNEIFKPVAQGYGAAAAAKVTELLDGPYSGWIGADGKEYAFSASEVKVLRDAAKSFFEKLEPALDQNYLTVLGGTEYVMVNFFGFVFIIPVAQMPLAANELGRQMDPLLLDTMEKVLYSVSEPTVTEAVEYSEPYIVPPVIKTANMRLAKFSYDLVSRQIGARLLAMRSENPDWMLKERLAAQQRWQAFFIEALGGLQVSQIDLMSVQPSVRKWIYDNQTIIFY